MIALERFGIGALPGIKFPNVKKHGSSGAIKHQTIRRVCPIRRPVGQKISLLGNKSVGSLIRAALKKIPLRDKGGVQRKISL